jgi:zona occludens toxin (predicted ATPase)
VARESRPTAENRCIQLDLDALNNKVLTIKLRKSWWQGGKLVSTFAVVFEKILTTSSITYGIMVAQMSDNPTPEQDKALAEARTRLAETPANVVVANHVVGLYELAAIHLGANPPRFDDARLAIDALAAIVDSLGDRLGDDYSTFKDALANIRLVYVKLTSED